MDCSEIRSAVRNVAVAISPVYIGRETPWFQVAVRVTTVVFLVAQVTEAVGEGRLAVPALTRVACLRHALSTVVLSTPQIGVWETLQGRRHCKVLYQFSLLLNNLHNILHATKISIFCTLTSKQPFPNALTTSGQFYDSFLITN